MHKKRDFAKRQLLDRCFGKDNQEVGLPSTKEQSSDLGAFVSIQ